MKHDVQEMLKHPAPYVWATASASVLIAAFQAYAKTRQRRIIIRKMKTGVTIDATNFSPTELKDMGVLDLLEFERIKANEKNPSSYFPILFSTQRRKAAKTQSIQIFPLRLCPLASLR